MIFVLNCFLPKADSSSVILFSSLGLDPSDLHYRLVKIHAPRMARAREILAVRGAHSAASVEHLLNLHCVHWRKTCLAKPESKFCDNSNVRLKQLLGEFSFPFTICIDFRSWNNHRIYVSTFYLYSIFIYFCNLI